ncbi:MAG: DUF2784 domain-containing protein [Candidatus Auribacterota bacterium]|nr:DUF2784 domain-containing protein [Candidatus Auribacterota bacterium]
MTYIVIISHLVFIIFVPLGGLLVFRKRWWSLVHIPVFLWGAMISFGGWICPITPLENWLRTKSGGMGYSGGFIEHYILPIIYPHNLTKEMQIGMGVAVLFLNLMVYGVVVRRGILKRRS